MRSSSQTDYQQRVSPRELPELMDGDCSYEDFRACLRSLEQVNRWLFGYRPTLAWLGQWEQELDRPIQILDVGSGGGDLLRQISAWSIKRGLAVELTGIDMNPHAARAAAESTPEETEITWVTGDALTYRSEKSVDIIVCSLMAHHLEDNEIVALLQWMDTTAQIGWFINDLERSERSSKWFRLLAALVGWHRFVIHDGPVSFRRAFKREDWEQLLTLADLPQHAVSVEAWRPGRLCVGRWKSNPQA